MKKLVPALLSISLLFSQCRPAKMALDTNGWENQQVLSVNGKKGLFTKERMNFGEYRTTSVKRSWTKGSGSRFGLGSGNVTDYDYTNIISLDYIRKKQTVRFSMTDDQNNQSEVYCISRFNTTDLTIGNRPNSIINIAIDILMRKEERNTFYVQLYSKQGERPWEMLIDNNKSQEKPKSYIGYLTYSQDHYYSIHPVHKMEGKDGKPVNILFGSVGFEFRDQNGKPVAAVSTLNSGVVYLQPLPAAERFLLANACAALLMQEMISA